MVNMVEDIINEWLTDCAELSSLELSTFATNLAQDEEIVQALYLLLEERSKYNEVHTVNFKMLLDLAMSYRFM